MIGSSARRHAPRHAGTGPQPADQWDWHEVVPNERLSPDHSRAVESGWTWGHTWTVVRLSVLPLLVTALALTTALLTLVGLVARPLPWSPAPLFGGSSDRQAAPAPASPTIVRSVPLRAQPAPSPTSTPRAAASVAGAAASGTPVRPGPTGSAGPTSTGGATSTSTSGPVLNVPLPPLPVSVSVSVSIPGPLPLPPLVITLP